MSIKENREVNFEDGSWYPWSLIFVGCVMANKTEIFIGDK